MFDVVKQVGTRIGGLSCAAHELSHLAAQSSGSTDGSGSGGAGSSAGSSAGDSSVVAASIRDSVTTVTCTEVLGLAGDICCYLGSCLALNAPREVHAHSSTHTRASTTQPGMVRETLTSLTCVRLTDSRLTDAVLDLCGVAGDAHRQAVRLICSRSVSQRIYGQRVQLAAATTTTTNGASVAAKTQPQPLTAAHSHPAELPHRTDRTDHTDHTDLDDALLAATVSALVAAKLPETVVRRLKPFLTLLARNDSLTDARQFLRALDRAFYAHDQVLRLNQFTMLERERETTRTAAGRGCALARTSVRISAQLGTPTSTSTAQQQKSVSGKSGRQPGRQDTLLTRSKAQVAALHHPTSSAITQDPAPAPSPTPAQSSAHGGVFDKKDQKRCTF